MKEYIVYMLRCSDGSLYTGMTSTLEKRLDEHELTVDPRSYVATHRPFELVYVETYRDVWDAINREKQIKNWSRKKKEALVAEKFEELPELAKRRTRYERKKKQ